MRLSTRQYTLALAAGLSAMAFQGTYGADSKDMPYQVLPWNGYKAAISLTYDDGDPIHLDLVIPEMDKRGLRGTFFLIAGKLMREGEWPAVAASGHEIGNHSMTHRHVNEMSRKEEKTEVTETRKKLEKIAGKPVLSFAYPFVEISPGLKKWVDADCLVARGGGGSIYYLTPDSEPDWLNIPSRATMSSYPFETYKDWVDQDLSLGAWVVLMIHAIEGSDWYQPVPKKVYLELLDYLVDKKEDLWVAPFLEVGAYWRAQKVLEASTPKEKGGKTVVRWEMPDNFPSGTVLKVRIEGEDVQVTQGGQPVLPLEKDVYPIDFDAREMTLVDAALKPRE